MLNVNQYNPHHVAKERYRRSVTKAWFADFWGHMTGSVTDLVRFEEVAQLLQLRQQMPRGIQVVALDQIVGSVGRARDFTHHFLPRLCVDEERWAQLAAAFDAMTPLPPVQLYQVGAVYFVRDGHHRISTARVYGLCELDADVVEFTSPVALQAKDFRQGHWRDLIEQSIKEEEMFVSNDELAKHAQTRAGQTGLVNQPGWQAWLRESLGNLCIACGTRLKALPQQEFG